MAKWFYNVFISSQNYTNHSSHAQGMYMPTEAVSVL